MCQQLCSIITSAILYGASYWYPAQIWWGSVASIVLIIRLRTTSVCALFWYGVVWGLIAYIMHMHGVVIGVVNLAANRIWYAWLPGIGLVFYLALCTGIIWAVGTWCENNSSLRLLPWLHGLWCGFYVWIYWLWITYTCLWPLGRCEGYLLANPIIPWAIYPPLLSVVSDFGVVGATFFACMLSGCIAFLNMQKICIVLLSSGLCLFFMCGIPDRTAYQALPVQHDSRWYQHVVTVTKPIIASVDQAASCRLVRDYVDQALCMCIEPVGVVFPESCFYAWSLCADSVLAEYMPLCQGTCDYIIGSFYDDHGQYRNSCYWLRDGVLQKRFDKRHAMPLIERLPQWLNYIEFVQLFFATMPEIVPSKNKRPVMQLGNTQCVPYICSELFFNRLPDDIYCDLPIVALVNDRWAMPYMQQLMYLGAVVQAHAWHREIFYVSYTRYQYIGLL